VVDGAGEGDTQLTRHQLDGTASEWTTPALGTRRYTTGTRATAETGVCECKTRSDGLWAPAPLRLRPTNGCDGSGRGDVFKGMTRLLLLPAVAISVAVSASSAKATGSARSCGSRTVGPTVIVTATQRGGPPCLLAAFRTCGPAVYELASFGVDTIARLTFTVTRSVSGCYLAVSGSFEVVPQKARPSGSGRCAAIVRRGSDIVATGCRGTGVTPVISLAGKRSR
jgi:hypothetical protein